MRQSLKFSTAAALARQRRGKYLRLNARLVEERHIRAHHIVVEDCHRLFFGRERMETGEKRQPGWIQLDPLAAARGKRTTRRATSVLLSHARKISISGQLAVPSGQIR